MKIKRKHIVKAGILESIREIPENEAWLFLPENKEFLVRIKKSLTEKATINLGSFKKYLKNR